MHKFIWSILLLVVCFYNSDAQTEFGIELGHQETFLTTPPKPFYTNYIRHTQGLKAGLFLEQAIRPKIGIRINLFYDLRHLDIINLNSVDFNNYHTLSLPIKVIFKAGKVVHFGLGVDPMLLFPIRSKSKKPLFHIGPCVEMAFRIRKMMRLSFYCHYDLVKTNYDSHGDRSNITAGVSFAFVLKKKKKIIYAMDKQDFLYPNSSL